MAAFWNRWAWLFVALALFAGVIPAWVYGDQREHYNGLLVAVGWVLFLVGGSLCKSRRGNRLIANWTTKFIPRPFVGDFEILCAMRAVEFHWMKRICRVIC